MPSSNPFADDLPPDIAPGPPSPDEALNPYAAPQNAGGYDTASARVVGVWRDGNYVVIHEHGRFPDRCLFTNEAASIPIRQELKWSHPIDWYQRSQTFEYGLSENGLAEHKRTRVRTALTQVGVAAFFLAVMFNKAILTNWMVIFVYLAIVAFVAIVAFLHTRQTRILVFRRNRDGYFWLRGPKDPFLNSLPAWPGTGKTKPHERSA